MIEYISDKNKTLSIIIRVQYQTEGIKFFTPPEYSQQLAYMNRNKGYIIPPHVHNIVERKVYLTQEVLLIKSGKVRVDYFDDEKQYLESRILNQGDVVLFSGGGHGFYMIEDSEIIEVKQGPYSGDTDKTRFDSIKDDQVKIKK